MNDPSQNENFQLLGCDDEDVFNAQLKAWTPPPKLGSQSVTLLVTRPGRTAAKTFVMRKDGKIEPVDYKAGIEFEVAEISVNCAWDLFRALQATADSKVESFVVRGAISAAGRAALARRGVILRRSSSDKWLESERHLVDLPSRMFIADVDHWPLPAGIASTDLAAQAVHVAARFAVIEPSFTNAALIAQASNSAGQSESEFSLKLWGWLREPTTTEDLRGWTHAMNAALGPTALSKAALDAMQARTGQPIYHHTPHFIGMTDPMQGRRWCYLHRGDGEIDLKLARRAAPGTALTSARPRVAAGPKNEQPSVTLGERSRVAAGFGKDQWKARLDAELGVSGCYGAIHTAAYAAVAAGASDEEIVAEIRTAAGDGRNFPSWSVAYVKEKTSPFFLASLIADARQREAGRSGRIDANAAELRTHLGLAARSESRKDTRAKTPAR
jgi:hypothetical protein